MADRQGKKGEAARSVGCRAEDAVRFGMSR